jgi:hypothetical protein
VTVATKTRNVLGLLEGEDLELRRLFDQVQRTGRDSVEEQARYGDLAKHVIRHVANRETALRKLDRTVERADELRRVHERLARSSPQRRSLLDQVEGMSRGILGINLNTGQDFDGPFRELVQLVGSEIEWDLDEAVPAVDAWLSQEDGDPDPPVRASRRH